MDFTLDAVLVSQRNRHWREHDHHGFEAATAVVLSEQIGPWAAGTPIQTVLDGLLLRLEDLESEAASTRVWGSFSLDSFIPDWFTLAGVILRGFSASFALDAELIRGGSFTLDAVLAGNGRFTLDALIV